MTAPLWYPAQMRKWRLSLGLFVLIALAVTWLAVPTTADEELPAFDTSWKAEFLPEDDGWKKAKQELIFNNGAEPETLDPAIMTGVTEHTLALALFEGLTSHHPETLEPKPGVADRWDISKDGIVYTFRLRKGATFTNGVPVTAKDFAWSWYRAIVNPDCDYAYLFFYIKGVESVYYSVFPKDKEQTPEKVTYEQFMKTAGLEIVSPRVLKVTLASPCAYFLDLASFETYMPVHKATVEKHGDRWTMPENFVGNGPFTLQEWSARKQIVMVPNERYWDRAIVKLKKITALAVDDIDVAYNKFTKGEVHWIRQVPIAKLDEAKQTPEYFVAPYLGSYFYRFNTEKLKDKNIRKALSLAVDRESITRDVTRAGQIPATWFCPSIPSAGYEPPKGLAYNPDEARRLMAAAGYPEGKGFPRLELLYNTNEDHKKVAERIGQMWQETLGISVALRNAEWKVYLKTVESLDYDIARAGWIGDYGDPMTFLDMWVTGAGNNNTGWSNKKYDDLIMKARFEGDLKKRREYLQAAERIVIEDEFPILPIYIYVNKGMRKENLFGWFETVRDLHPFQYMYFEAE